MIEPVSAKNELSDLFDEIEGDVVMLDSESQQKQETQPTTAADVGPQSVDLAKAIKRNKD